LEFVDVDGSQGEGGGQILRTAVSLSAILRKPVRVTNIRAGRPTPGLKRQHLSALQVLTKVFGGTLEGASEGSSSIAFVPGGAKAGSLSLDMGTAASITLVLQAVVPAVALSRERLTLDLVGGTDVPWSPTFDYFQRVVRGAYRTIGINFEVACLRRGYYPRGGGRASAAIEPCERVLPLDLTGRAEVAGVTLLSRCGSLPRHVAERQLSAAVTQLEKSGLHLLSSEVSEEQADSPGSSFLAYNLTEGVFLGADALGARGKPAEEVGLEAAKGFAESAKSGAPVDSHLADMVLPLLSLAAGPSKVRVHQVTDHLRSGLALAAQFTSCTWAVEDGDGSAVVSVTPNRA
jgi:RNA 3'-phosphate cyclase